jgi:raffinose/stachyose/melibiose transport system substrate-binding protein
MVDGAGDPVTRNGRLYGMPEAIEGFGFAYNRVLFAQAGINTLPDTLDSLARACQKLQAAGIQPFTNGYAEWWVLGNHNLSVPLAHQPDINGFLASIIAGKSSFADSIDAAGWLKLLDLTIRYGQPNATETGDYASAVADFASGKAAMIQQGNWIQPLLDKANPGIAVGFLPIPINNTPDRRIPVGIPNYWIINRDSAQDQAARDWLTWLVSSPTGKHYLVDDLKYVPAFKNIPAANLTGLNAALSQAVSTGQTYPWQFPRLPTGASVEIAHAMTSYLTGEMKADRLFRAIDEAIIAAAERAKS